MYDRRKIERQKENKQKASSTKKMIDLAITVLIYSLIPAAIFQKSVQRLFAALVFVGVIHLHHFSFTGLEGGYYLVSGALFSLGTIILTSGINPPPKIVLNIQKICIVSAICNLIGWVLWENYISSDYYNMSFVVVYGWAFFTLIERDKNDVGNYTIDGLRSCFRFNHHPIYRYLSQNKGQA